MPRVAVTYEQVAAVANSLYAAGDKNPGTKAVRDELAKRVGPGGTTGSPNTIQRHLDQWRAQARPVEPQDMPQLPAQLAGDIQRALNAAAAVAREKVEERLLQVQAELDELAAAGELNEARIDELAHDLAARTSERDSMQGQLTQRTSEVEELKAALAAAMEKAAAFESALHTAQLEAQEASGRVEEIRRSTDKQLAEMRAERDQARADQAGAEKRTVVAEKEAVGAQARLEGEREARAGLEARVGELVATVARLEPEAARAAAAMTEVSGLKRELERSDATITMLRGLVDQTGAKAPAGTQASSAGKTPK